MPLRSGRGSRAPCRVHPRCAREHSFRKPAPGAPVRPDLLVRASASLDPPPLRRPRFRVDSMGHLRAWSAVNCFRAYPQVAQRISRARRPFAPHVQKAAAISACVTSRGSRPARVAARASAAPASSLRRSSRLINPRLRRIGAWNGEIRAREPAGGSGVTPTNDSPEWVAGRCPDKPSWDDRPSESGDMG